jgi:hypothetical protein
MRCPQPLQTLSWVAFAASFGVRQASQTGAISVCVRASRPQIAQTTFSATMKAVARLPLKGCSQRVQCPARLK